MLNEFSGDVRNMFAHHFQQPVTTIRQGLMACRQLGIIDKNMVRKMYNLDLAAKVTRHLTKQCIGMVLRDLEAEFTR